MRCELSDRAIAVFDPRTDGAAVLLAGDKLATIAYVHIRKAFGDGLEQRLERILRNELIWLTWQRRVIACCDFGLRLRNRRVGKMQQRRLNQGRDDKYVHRAIARKSGSANFIRNSHPAIDFHGAGVAPLHFRKKLRGCFLLKQYATHASPAQVDCERQPDGASADDENLRIQSKIPD